MLVPALSLIRFPFGSGYERAIKLSNLVFYRFLKMHPLLMKHFSLVLVAFVSLIFEAVGSRPNILIVFTDDQRFDQMGCAGHPIAQTPQIDALAEEGIRFTHAYVNSPMCMPSRVTLLTGLTQRTHGVLNRIKAPFLKAQAAQSFPALLRKNGYTAAMYGKTHFIIEGGKETFGEMFDDYVGYERPYWRTNKETGERWYTEDRIHAHSLDFLRSQKHSKKPFCLIVSYNLAHAEDRDRRPGYGHFPWPSSVSEELYSNESVPPPDLGDDRYFKAAPEFLQTSLNRIRYFWRWDTEEKYQANIKGHYRMITGIDQMLGQYRDTLEEAGIADNTIILFTSDNGFFLGNRGFAGKWSHYDESIHVPFIVYDPRIRSETSNQTDDALISNTDIAATVLDWAGIDIPQSYQGRSFKPLIESPGGLEWRKSVYLEHLLEHPDIPSWRGLKTSRFIYANYLDQEAGEVLHDLNQDPEQLVNVAGNPEYASDLASLRTELENYKNLYPERKHYSQLE